MHPWKHTSRYTIELALESQRLNERKCVLSHDLPWMLAPKYRVVVCWKTINYRCAEPHNCQIGCASNCAENDVALVEWELRQGLSWVRNIYRRTLVWRKGRAELGGPKQLLIESYLNRTIYIVSARRSLWFDLRSQPIDFILAIRWSIWINTVVRPFERRRSHMI